MKTLFLLITLTQNGAGDINASFVNTHTLQQCQQKTQIVEGVFKASAITVIESRCIKSDVQFSDFGHASTASNIRNFYLIKRDEKSLSFLLMPDWQTCMRQQRSEQAINVGKSDENPQRVYTSVYCSSSVQAPV